jgi:hypothetical protein
MVMFTDPVADGASVTYSVSNTTVGSFSSNSGTTNSTGENRTTLTVTENGSVTTYVTSGAGGDRVEFDVQGIASTAGSPTYTYVDSFRDGDGSTEPSEDPSLPPTGPVGDVQNFVDMTSDTGSYATVVEQDAGGGPPPQRQYRLGLAASSIPPGSAQTIQINYEFTQDAKDITTELVYANGTEVDPGTTYAIQSGQTSVNLTLSASETQYLNNNGTVYLVLTTPTDPGKTTVRIYYVRVKTE